MGQKEGFNFRIIIINISKVFGSLILGVIGNIIANYLIEKGVFSNILPNYSQLVGPITGFIIFGITIYFLILRRKPLLILLEKVILYWKLILGITLLIASIWGFILIKSYIIFINSLSFTIAVLLLNRYATVWIRDHNTKSNSKFISIPIIPGVGSKYFEEFYVDGPTGEIVLGGVKFIIQRQSLVFDTANISYCVLREDGCKVVTFNCSSLIDKIKSIHFLTASGNSKQLYYSAKIGEIQLIFREAPPITKNLILGEDIREWCVGAPGNLVRVTTNPNTKVVWQGVNQDGTLAIIDCLNIPIPNLYRTCVLEQIAFVHRPLQRQDDTLGVQFMVFGITVETGK